MSGGNPEPSALCPMDPAGPGAGAHAWRVEAGITPRSLGRGGPGCNGHLHPPPESSTAQPHGQLHTATPRDSRPQGGGLGSCAAASSLSQGSRGRPGPRPEPGISGHCPEPGWLRKLRSPGGPGGAGEGAGGLGTHILAERLAGVIRAGPVAGAEEPGL